MVEIIDFSERHAVRNRGLFVPLTDMENWITLLTFAVETDVDYDQDLGTQPASLFAIVLQDMKRKVDSRYPYHYGDLIEDLILR